MKTTNTARVIYLLIKELGVSVTMQSIDNELQIHPNAHSLLCISELLSTWRIPNEAYDLSLEELLDLEIQTPLIANSSVGKGKFIIVHKITKNFVIASCEDWFKKNLNIDEFKRIYRGSILIAEKETDSGEEDFNIKNTDELVNKIRIPFVIVAATISLAVYLSLYTTYSLTLNWTTTFLIIVKTTGLITTILLLVQSLDTKNVLIQKLCGSNSEKNCNAILSSKAARLNGFLSWSEIGFFYFGGTWLTLLFNGTHNNIMLLLSVMSFLCLPYTCYSIYYQWRIARQWCILCCTVQALLWSEFLIFVIHGFYIIQIHFFKDFGILIIDFSVPVIAWSLLKPYLLQLKELQPLKEQLHQFKYNKDVFHKMLGESKKCTLPAKEDSLIIGNQEADSTIILVSNPYCTHCAEAHRKIDELMKSRSDIKLQLLFLTPNTKDNITRAASHILALNIYYDQALIKTALNDWYKKKYKNYEAWAKRYPVKDDLGPNQKLNYQKNWSIQAGAVNTPAIFINGQRLPTFYKPEEIKYLV